MRKSLISDVIISIVMFGIGLFLLMYGQTTMDMIIMVLGISAILYGIFNIITYFRYRLTNNPVSNLVYGILACVFGLILTISPDIISKIIAFIIGAFILFVSIPSLVDAIKNKDKVNHVSIGLSIAGIVIGVLCIMGKLLPTDLAFKFMGLILIIYSITNLINVILLNQGLNSNKPKIYEEKNEIEKK